jgi:hypothetical protein
LGNDFSLMFPGPFEAISENCKTRTATAKFNYDSLARSISLPAKCKTAASGHNDEKIVSL